MPAPADGALSAEAPAGFWRRAAAWCVDLALLSPILFLVCRGPARAMLDAVMGLLGTLQAWTLERMLADDSLLAGAASAGEIRRYALALARQVLADPGLQAQLQAFDVAMTGASVQLFLRTAAIAALWFVGFERSAWAATPGKRLLGLRVADLHGQPVRWERALGRFAAGGLSWLTLNLGHALAGWRRDHRALHDLVAGTQVLGRGPTPRWARAFILAIVLCAVLLPFALAARMLWMLGGG